ncbi:MAG TPA: di-trans,poly-cis-decaprenylcistransferase [Gemmatimonadales bacterium]
MSGLHVAIIMDGNGRWAEAQGLQRAAGHREGARAVRRVVEAAPGLGIGTVTLYAFSSDNWRRPSEEVSWLMRLFRTHLRSERRSLTANGVRLNVVGRRDRLPQELRSEIEATERATQNGEQLWLRVAVDYSARDAIVRAAQLAGPDIDRARFERLLTLVDHSAPVEPVDLLIRSGGERRLSDFLLWECAYAELHFTPRLWPDFNAEDLEAAIRDFHQRDRRFGGLTSDRQAGAA